jgi:hypothetical protein
MYSTQLYVMIKLFSEQIRGHLWFRYSVTTNQKMVTTVKLSKQLLQFNHQEFHGFDKRNTAGAITWTGTAYHSGAHYFTLGFCGFLLFMSSNYMFSCFKFRIVLSSVMPMGRYRCGTSGVYVWAKLTLLLINMW